MCACVGKSRVTLATGTVQDQIASSSLADGIHTRFHPAECLPAALQWWKVYVRVNEVFSAKQIAPMLKLGWGFRFRLTVIITSGCVVNDVRWSPVAGHIKIEWWGKVGKIYHLLPTVVVDACGRMNEWMPEWKDMVPAKIILRVK